MVFNASFLCVKSYGVQCFIFMSKISMPAISIAYWRHVVDSSVRISAWYVWQDDLVPSEPHPRLISHSYLLSHWSILTAKTFFYLLFFSFLIGYMTWTTILGLQQWAPPKRQTMSPTLPRALVIPPDILHPSQLQCSFVGEEPIWP